MDMITLAMAKTYADRFITTAQEVLVHGAKTNETNSVYASYASDSHLNVAEGDNLIVTLDGVEYSCTVYTFEGFLCFGTTPLLAVGPDAPYPFGGVIQPAGFTFIANTDNETKAHTFRIVKNITVFDPKYVRQSFVIDLPITLGVLFSGTEIPVDDDIAAQLDMAAKNYIPVDIRVEMIKNIYSVYHFNLCLIGNDESSRVFRFQAYSGAECCYVGYDVNRKVIIGWKEQLRTS